MQRPAQEQSITHLIQRLEKAEDQATFKDVLIEALNLLMMARDDIRILSRRLRALEETGPDQAALEEARADVTQLLELTAGTPQEHFAMAVRRCIYDENWQEADTALAAFRESGEARDLALRIRGRLIDFYS